MIGIVVVIYHSHGQAFQYITQELPKISLPCKALVVDLASEAESSREFARKIGAVWFEDKDIPPERNASIHVLHTPWNLGYARGNNLGASCLLELDPDIDKLLFSNDDVEFQSKDIVEALARRLDEMPSVGAVGPRLVDFHGRLQQVHDERPSVWKECARNMLEPFVGAARFTKAIEKPGRCVGKLEGCFLMVRASDYIMAGMFDSRTFLYWEESILERRMAGIGRSFYYEPSVTLRHYVGKSTSAGAPGMLLLKSHLFGLRLYFREYESCARWKYAILCLSCGMRLFLVWLASVRRRMRKFFPGAWKHP